MQNNINSARDRHETHHKTMSESEKIGDPSVNCNLFKISNEIIVINFLPTTNLSLVQTNIKSGHNTT